MPTCSRPGPAASIWTDGPATAERPALAKVRCRAGQSQDRLVADQRDGMVRRSAAQAGNRLQHRGLVSLRTAARADPLGAGARSLRRTRTAGISQHRPHGQAGANSRLVRLTLAHGDDVSGSADPPWRGDAAAVV